MPQFEDVLATLCSEVQLSHANESQKIFLLNDAKEARLACDVLAAHGFDAKVYAEANASKLYITMPPSDAAMEQKISAALAYAVSLKQMKQNLDMLYRDKASALQSPDYTITFSNTLPAGKQVIVNFAPAARSEAAAPSQPVALPPPSPAPARQVPQDARKMVKKSSKKGKLQERDPFYFGPAVGNSALPKAARKESGLWDELRNYMSGHMVASIYVMLTAIIGLILLFSFFTFAKAFICPDFATEKAKKNHAWYCTYEEQNQ